MKRHVWNRGLAVLIAVFVLLSFVKASDPVLSQAASKITLKSGAAAPATVYAGHSYNLKVAGVKVKFTTSNKKVATIGATTGKMKVVAPGSVKITAKNAKSGKVVASKTFHVLQRSKSVNVDSTLYLSKVGDTATIRPTLTPATSTDVIRFTTSDKEIATVGATSGKVTAKKIGKTTINVYAKATKATANSNKNNKVATVTVYVREIPGYEKALIYFDAGDVGVINKDAAFKEVNFGYNLGSLPTISDIEMSVAEDYELVGWTRTPFPEEIGLYSHIDSINALVTPETTVDTDMTLYAVWKTPDNDGSDE